MAHDAIPHFHNDAGAPMIEIGCKEFMCTGATAPFDHPHIFLDMGDDAEIICSYCSTHFRYARDLSPEQSRPPGCLIVSDVA